MHPFTEIREALKSSMPRFGTVQLYYEQAVDRTGRLDPHLLRSPTRFGRRCIGKSADGLGGRKIKANENRLNCQSIRWIAVSILNSKNFEAIRTVAAE